jgi:transposase
MEPSVTEYARIAVDTSKYVFTLHGVDAKGTAACAATCAVPDFVDFFSKLPPTQIAMEACGGSYHWARELQALGPRSPVVSAARSLRSGGRLPDP